MLGLGDIWVALAFYLCIFSSLLCIVYGALNWNKGDDSAPSDEDRAWVKEEDKLEEEL